LTGTGRSVRIAALSSSRRFHVSVIVTVRFSGDPARAKQVADADPERIRSIAETGRARGALHHRFAAGEGEILVIDEWESAEAFQSFFEENAEIPGLLEEIGVTGEPRVEVWQPLEMHDEF
jgi:quinol monooxygenase YgiN